MKFPILLILAAPFSVFAMEAPVGTLGNSNKVFNALIEAGAEMKSTTAGTGTVELIRASNLVCRFESAPDLDALCTFYTKGDNGPLVKGRGLHNAGYDFNDDNLTYGAAFWCQLAERFLR